MSTDSPDLKAAVLDVEPADAAAPRPAGGDPTRFRRMATLWIVSVTQLLVVLDGTIVTIALPSAQAGLGISDAGRQWVVTAYALTFGSLLLLGGRAADFVGRKTIFLVGLVGFGVASGLGGLADSGAELLLARAGQGAFAALMAPAALAILTVTFPHGRERNTAFAVFGSVAGAGSAVGLLLGGVLTEYLGWRWCLWVNLPFAVAGLIAGMLLLQQSRAVGDRSYDLPGAATVTVGFGLCVGGLSILDTSGTPWRSVAMMGAGLGLLAAFVAIERRATNPLLPLRILTNPVRAAAMIIQALVGAVMVGAMLYLTFHLQQVLGLSPIRAGVATLPITISLMSTVPFATRMLNRAGPRRQLIIGPTVGAVGVLWLTQISVAGSYWTHVLPGIVIFGIGMGLTLVPLQNLALLGVANHDAGAASAAATAANQIGGSVGLAALTVLYVSIVGGHTAEEAVMVQGYRWVFAAGAGVLLVTAVLAATLVRTTPPAAAAHSAAPLTH